MKGLLAERPQVPKSYRDALITTLMPLLSKMRSLATKFCASKRNHPTQPQLSTLIVSRGAATMTHRVGDHLPATPLSQDIISAIGATKALLDFSPSAPILHAHLSLPPGLTLAQWSGIRLELHAPGASALDYDTFTYVRGSPQSEIFVKASPYADGAFRSPVAPTFLTDLLKSWGDDETRSRLLPGVMVIQRCSTRRRVSDEGTRGDVVAIIYTLDVAPTPEAASVTLAHMCSLLPEHMSDEGSSHGAEESWSMMEWNPEVNFPLTASGVYMPLESMASSTWTSLPSSSVSSEDISFSFHLDAPSTFDTPLLSSFPEASYNSDSLPPPPIPMSPHLHLQTPKPRKTIRMNSMYLESMIFAAKSGINPFQQMGGNAGLAATKFTSLLSGWNKM
ncbi:hypothetical protein FRB96_007634 [Tulasnella sp. 330]|nr:hypothetical protein FRB96_007634 [Tulasnella sp. 330]KAG8873765.1 hypothetical protein FRB97_006448 [Tulasnella sp. 331]